MTGKTIVDLPTGTTPTGNEPFETVQSGISVKLALQTIADFANATINVTEDTGTSYTFVLVDSGGYKQLTNASTITATVPPNSSVAFPVGSMLNLEQGGAGVIVVAAGGGVTINSATASYTSNGQFSVISLMKVALNTWTIFGNLV